MTAEPSRSRTPGHVVRASGTRQRLIAAAEREFEQRGYVACSIEDIVRAAGTSRSTFYTHFQSKGEVIEGLWDVRRRPLLALYRELLAMPVCDHASVSAWLGRTFDWWNDNAPLLLAIHESIGMEEALAEACTDRIHQVGELLTPLIEQRLGISHDRAHMRGVMLAVQHERFCYFWVLRRAPLDPEVARETLTELWLDQIGHDASA